MYLYHTYILEASMSGCPGYIISFGLHTYILSVIYEKVNSLNIYNFDSHLVIKLHSLLLLALFLYPAKEKQLFLIFNLIIKITLFYSNFGAISIN